jgi:hypothetical protein
MARLPTLRGAPLAAQWAALALVSALFVAALAALRLPAALLLAPMAAAILVACAHGSARVPEAAFVVAQGFIGCLAARSIKPSFVGEMAHLWPIFLGGVFSVIAASYALGWLLARSRVLPGTIAIWGSAPGASTAMVVMAEAFGADVRLVAFMQYLRVVLVAVVASAVARLWMVRSGAPLPAAPWFPGVAWTSFAGTVGLVLVAIGAARWARMPAGGFLAPFVAAAVCQGSGVLAIELPPWLLAGAYATVGWSIGLRFSRPTLVHVARALPRVAASILLLIAICAGMAAALSAVAHIDPLTAYLAMSPGGADTAAIIAASSDVDMPFVMTMQTTRFLVILLTGPAIARFVARRLGATPKVW